MANLYKCYIHLTKYVILPKRLWWCIPCACVPRKSYINPKASISLQWCHNGRDGVSNHHPHHCLLKRLFRRRSKKTSKLRLTGLCAGNSPECGEFTAQRASNAENVSIWWRHHIIFLSDEARVICTGLHSILQVECLTKIYNAHMNVSSASCWITLGLSSCGWAGPIQLF